MRATRTLVLAVLLGAVVGALSGLYLRAVHLLEDTLWAGTEPRVPLEPWLATLLLCTAGGVLVGLIRLRHDRDTPNDLEDALSNLDDVIGADETGTPAALPKVSWLLRAAVLGVVSLGFGASLGPEAPLVVIATGLGQRVARILRISQSEAAYISASGAMSGLFGGPLGAVVMPLERSRHVKRAASMVVYGVVAAVAGLVALVAVLPDGGGLRYEMPESSPGTGRDLLTSLGWAALAAVPATVVGLLLLVLIVPSRRLAEKWVESTVLRAAAGGVVLAGCVILAPLVLFSGEHEGQDLIDRASSSTVWGLLGLVLVKLVATLACITTGWFGGQIFPAVFTGMAAALLVVVVFPGAPVDAVVAAGAGAGATAVLRRPLAAVLFMLFFFPPTTLLALTVGAAVATAAVHVLGDRVPEGASLQADH